MRSIEAAATASEVSGEKNTILKMSMGWLLTLGTLFVAACAIMAAFGFKGRVTTIGVDLGTTFSVVGISSNGVVQIVSDKQGRKIFPSIVSFLNGGKVSEKSDLYRLTYLHTRVY